MAVTSTEEHLAQGDWSVDIDWNASIYDELTEVAGGKRRPRKLTAQFYDASANLVYTGVLLRVTGDRYTGLTIGGRGPIWHTGSGQIGPTIADYEFVSGQNKLGNGYFYLLNYYTDPADGTVKVGAEYFRKPPTGSFWFFNAGGAINSGAGPGDDILESDEKFPTRPGYAYRLQASKVTGVGRLRIRTVYEGRFAVPNLIVNPNMEGGSGGGGAWTNVTDITLVTDPPNSLNGSNVMKCGPSTLRAPVNNPSFEFGLGGWVSVSGTWAANAFAHYEGANAATTTAGGPGAKYLQSDSNITTPLVVDGYSITAGQRWRFEGALKGTSTANGTARIEVLMGGPLFPADSIYTTIAERSPSANDNGTEWRHGSVEIDVPATMTSFVMTCVVFGHTAGDWYFDLVKATRIIGNTDQIFGWPVNVTPERSYRWSLHARSDPSYQSGDARMQVEFAATGGGRPIIRMESAPFDQTNNEWTVFTFDFTPPSGYDVVTPSIISTDIVGGPIYVDGMTLSDTNTTTAVVDSFIDNPSTFTPVHVDSIAPTGAEFVHAQLVAEVGSGWVVGDLSLARIGVTPVTGNVIVAKVLTDPITGLPLSLLPGTVTCPEVTPYDWRAVNLTDRAALEHYCAVVSDPVREYKVNPGSPPTIDVGTAVTLFIDHAPDSASPIVLLAEDIDVAPVSNAVLDTELRPTEVQVIGATRQTVSGNDFLITATAQVPGTPEFDWFGRPIRRTKIVSDGTVDHFGYAQALADDLAAKEAEPALSLSVTLDTSAGSGITRPAYREGDWLYIYKPDAGIEDPANPTTINGVEVFPRRVRIFTRQRIYGARCRVDIRRADGTTFDLSTKTGVIWSDQDADVLTVGDKRPAWQSDPQGGPVGNQYLRDRASSPR